MLVDNRIYFRVSGVVSTLLILEIKNINGM